MANNFIEHSILSFNAITKKPEKILSNPKSLVDSTKKLLKENYDFLKQQEDEKDPETLQELIVDGFDVEQIWQQLELQNKKLLDLSVINISRLIAAKDSLTFQVPNDESDSSANQNDEVEENGELSEDSNLNLEEANSDSDKNNSDLNDDKLNSDDDIEEDPENYRKPKSNNQNSIKKSVVDDDFFKLDEMERFLKQEESGKKKKSTLDDSEESEDESIDLFKSDLDDDQSDDDENNLNPKYSDFFESNENSYDNNEENLSDRENNSESDDSELELSDLDIKNDKEPMSGDENSDAEEKTAKNEPKSDSSDDDDDSDDDNNETKNDAKSSLEVREERLKKKIEQIEDQALQEKSWQLKGEVTASNRPQNSLLEEVVEFDLTSRPAPVITQETTFRLEDLIKQRIKDKAFDDVERKIKPVETPLEYKKKLVLEQEKSKQSLAQIYEQEYLKQKEALDPDAADKEEEVPKEHIEIKTLMKNLFAKLDSLSNFHFTPKQAAPELKIVNNLPAISMEEVAPLAVSDATLLAPEEIKNKPKGDIIGKGERTKTDKKRERRKKKTKQKIHAIEKQKKDIISAAKPGKLNKKKSDSLMAKITKDRNVSKLNENSKTVKSSTAFFSQLEDEVKGHINSKRKCKDVTDKPKMAAKKFKL